MKKSNFKKILMKLEKDRNLKKIERKLITVLFEAFPDEFINLFRWSKAYEEIEAYERQALCQVLRLIWQKRSLIEYNVLRVYVRW